MRDLSRSLKSSTPIRARRALKEKSRPRAHLAQTTAREANFNKSSRSYLMSTRSYRRRKVRMMPRVPRPSLHQAQTQVVDQGHPRHHRKAKTHLRSLDVGEESPRRHHREATVDPLSPRSLSLSRLLMPKTRKELDVVLPLDPALDRHPHLIRELPKTLLIPKDAKNVVKVLQSRGIAISQEGVGEPDLPLPPHRGQDETITIGVVRAARQRIAAMIDIVSVGESM